MSVSDGGIGRNNLFGYMSTRRNKDIYEDYKLISVTRFVRDRELGLHRSIPGSLNIKYRHTDQQWTERSWDTYESELRSRMELECHRLHDSATKSNLVTRDTVSSSLTKRVIFDYYFHKFRCNNSSKQSLVINVKCADYTFLEIVLFTESKIFKPLPDFTHFHNNLLHYCLKYPSYEDYVYEHAQMYELIRCVRRTVRLRDTSDEANDDTLFKQFSQSMWSFYDPHEEPINKHVSIRKLLDERNRYNTNNKV